MKFNNIIFSEVWFNDQPSAWIEHYAFAFFLVEKLKPNVFVELGTHHGGSYFAFCQAIKELHLQTKAYAVDTWIGDEHAGFYGHEVYQHVSHINQEHFAWFSNLLKTTFDDAVQLFEDGSIDLLHIDGLHTYEAVKHDFETWLPKMSDSGVVIFHDTAVKERGFGVWKLMEELREKYPYFEFEHGYGLGVLCTGSKINSDVLNIFETASDDFAKNLFSTIGRKNMLEFQEKLQNERIEALSNDLEAKNQSVRVKDEANQKLRQRVEQLQQQIRNAETTLDHLREVLESKTRDIQDLNALKEQLSLQNASMINDYIIIQKQIEEKVLDNQRLQLELSEVAGHKQELETILSSNQKQLDDHNTTISYLRNQLNHSKHLINAITNSPSWKITVPLRKLKKFIKYSYLVLLPHKSLIEKSGYFDKQFYLNNNPDVAKSKMSAIRHFLVHGGKEGRNPSPFFNTTFYLNQYPDVKYAGINPLVHYLRYGEKEGREASPDIKRIIRIKQTPRKDSANRINRFKRKVIERLKGPASINLLKKSELFDAQYYLRLNPDVEKAGIDPAKHYYYHGWREGRDPSKLFDSQFYLSKYSDVMESGMNPLIHYIKYGKSEARIALNENPTSQSEHILSAEADTLFEPADTSVLDPMQIPVKIVAFYLPQFHPILENDQWWGKGFTEWTNVTKAKPYFEGHHQPNLPLDLGFYDLRVPEVMEQQINMAKSFGIHAFCFHYYWFSGKRLLEKPLDMFIEHKEWDFNFCICWANENWTRRWDGMDHEILLEQQHTPDDDLAFIKDASKYLNDRRYLTIHGKPLLVIYRPQLLPDMNRTVHVWKDYYKSTFGKDLYVVMAQTFGKYDPREFGLDGALEFPPHNVSPKLITNEFKTYNYSGHIFNIDFLKNNTTNKIKTSEYDLFRGLIVNWDNTPRKGKFGNVYLGNTPEVFKDWLSEIISDNRENKLTKDERIVFLNAWNEWAEGAYLEPDRRYGYAYLNAIKDVLKKNLFTCTKNAGQTSKYRVSVIIPNYNHEAYIEQRLYSIIFQSYQVSEIIFLDDASTDNSLAKAKDILQNSGIDYTIINNQVNSGNVFSQWLKGIEQAKENYIWIAESDDSAHADFLMHVIKNFEKEDVLIVYGNICYIDQDTRYHEGLENYYLPFDSSRWYSSHTQTAYSLFSNEFAVKNLIPNVSGCVFRKTELSDKEVERLKSYKFAGDWYFYSLISRGGLISYAHEAKSYFRLNNESVSRTSFYKNQHLDDHKKLLYDLRDIYGISDQIVEKHAKELFRIFSLQPNDLIFSNVKELFSLIRPTNKRTQLRICIACYSFSVGGGELAPISLANALRERGHHISFMVMENSVPGEDPLFREKLRSDIPVLYFNEHLHKFQLAIYNYGWEIFNSHNISFEYNLFINNYIPQIKYISTLHGSYENEAKLVDKPFIDYLDKQVNKWLYTAEKNKTFLNSKDLVNNNFTKVFNAIPNFRKSFHDIGLRERLKLPDDSLIFVQASRAIISKGWDISIKVIEKLRAISGKNIHLVLLGDGEDLYYYKKISSNLDYIHFTGMIPDVRSVVFDADFAIFPSLFFGESRPLFILEALSLGLPVFATDIGNVKELLIFDDTKIAGGLIEVSHDKSKIVEGLSTMIHEFLTKAKELNDMREIANLQFAKFSLENLCNIIIDCFIETIEFNKTAPKYSVNYNSRSFITPNINKNSNILYIHAGLHKTGTSSIQYFFSQYRDQILSRNNFWYPPSVDSKYAPRQHRFIIEYFEKDLKSFVNYCNRLNKKEAKILLSSECFNEKPYYAKMLGNLLHQYENVVVLIALRRQDYWLESLYRFILFNKDASRLSLPFNSWVDMMMDGSYRWYNANYLKVLEIWDNVFKGNIRIIPYNDLSPDYNSISHILDTLNISCEVTLKTYFNSSLRNREAVEVCRKLNLVDASQIRSKALDAILLNDKEDLSFFSTTKRIEVINHFAAINKAISDKYNRGVPIFSDKMCIEPDWQPFGGITSENINIVNKILKSEGLNIKID